MRIGLFPTIAGRKGGGVEVYEIELVRGLAGCDVDNEYHVFCSDTAAIEAFGLTAPNVVFHRLRPRFRALAYSLSLPLAVRNARCELLHSTYVPPLHVPVPGVFTLHDTSVFDHPEFYHLRHRRLLQWLQSRGVAGARRIVCGSRTALEAGARRFPQHAARMCVVFNGIGQRLPRSEPEQARLAMRTRFGVAGPYALYVGQLRTRHKNLEMLLEAFRLCANVLRPEPLRLVMVGKRSWTTVGLEEAIERRCLAEAVVLPGHISAEDLATAYCGARMVAFPSKSEGFGFTVVEAMSLGTPVIAARATCLPEIVGDAGLLVDPDSATELAAAMVRLFLDPDLCAQLSRAGLARAANFSWTRAARETVRVYQQAMAIT